MDRSAVAALVEKHLPTLQRQFGLGRWTITVDYEAQSAGDGYLTRGECTRMIDYEQAVISLNPDALDDEAAVLETLRHELFHVVASPWDIYTTAVDRLELSGSERAMLERLKEHAGERTVAALERLYAGVTTDAERNPGPGTAPGPDSPPHRTLVLSP